MGIQNSQKGETRMREEIISLIQNSSELSVQNIMGIIGYEDEAIEVFCSMCKSGELVRRDKAGAVMCSLNKGRPC